MPLTIAGQKFVYEGILHDIYQETVSILTLARGHPDKTNITIQRLELLADKIRRELP